MGISRDVKPQPRKEMKKGGTRAALFVYAMEGLENMAFASTTANISLYLISYMHFSITKSVTTLTNFMGTSLLLTLIGGIISDTYLSRFKTCVIFGCVEVAGYAVLTAQAYFHQLRPIPCSGELNQCETANTAQIAILFTGLYLIAFGTSGVKVALPSLGANQFNEKDPKEALLQSSFFNWLLFSLITGAIFGVTVIAWIGENKGKYWLFGICTAAVLFSVLFLCMGKSFYRNNVPKESPILHILQVIVAAIRNRNFPTPEKGARLHEIYDTDNDTLQRTDQLRFLDKAAMVRSSKNISTPITQGPWSLCTVTHVEETKSLIRFLPIIISTAFINVCLAQFQTFSVLQSYTMDRNLLGFKVPASSIPMIPLLVLFILVPTYDRILVPLARKWTGIPTGIRHLQRVGVGLVLSIISMAVAGLVETRRKNVAFEHHMVESNEPLPMSVFWLGFQYGILGAADLFTSVGILEFLYAESSSRMKSLGLAISYCSGAFGYFLSSVIVEVVNDVSGGWLADGNNLNKDKLNYFYWLLSVISILNFGVYLVCASSYKYKVVEVKQMGTINSCDAEP